MGGEAAIMEEVLDGPQRVMTGTSLVGNGKNGRRISLSKSRSKKESEGVRVKTCIL